MKDSQTASPETIRPVYQQALLYERFPLQTGMYRDEAHKRCLEAAAKMHEELLGLQPGETISSDKEHSQ